jgi:UV DNA damage repair endonuclease
VIKRIGFACKWIDHPTQVNGISAKDDAKQYNTGATTVAWLNRQSKAVAEQRLWDLMVQNIEATRRLVERVGTLDERLRMVRLSSDILPVYTERSWSYFWLRSDVVEYLEQGFARVGQIAREHNVRLSFHPGQFTVLASDNPDIVERSLEEFEYHADMARFMGYGKEFQDFKINVHIAGRAGPAGIRSAYSRLSPEARNCITIENEEISHGLSDCLTISDLVPIVLDIHHYFIREGEYIQPTDLRIPRLLDSWRGIRPVCHFSQSREDYLVDHPQDIAPDYNLLLEQGYKKQKLRAHSEFMWNTAVNTWAHGFWENFDVMVEAKGKNLASFELAEFWKSLEK